MSGGRGGRPWRRLRAQVLATSNVCHLCGKPGADSADHIIPVSLGGRNVLSNCRAAHLRCNIQRGNAPIISPHSRVW